MEHREAVRVVELIAAYWPNFKPTDATVAVWASNVAEFGFDEAAAAVRQVARQGREWPNLGVIVQAVHEARGDLPPDGEPMFDLVWAASRMRSGGLVVMTPARRFDWPHPLVNAVIDSIGWRNLSSMEHEPSARAHWMGTWGSFARRARSEVLGGDVRSLTGSAGELEGPA